MRIAPNAVSASIVRDSRDAQTSAKAGESSSSSDAASVVKLSIAGTAASSDAGATSGATGTTTTRLQTIRAMLDKGNYPVDLDVLASRIVDDEFVRAGKS